MGHLIPEGLKEIRRKHERERGKREKRGEERSLLEKERERRKRKLKRQEWNFERRGGQ